MRAQEAKNQFINMLDQSGYNEEEPDAVLAWETFKRFCLEYKMNCVEDAVLFHCGCNQAKLIFDVKLTRQFVFKSKGGDYDHEHLEFTLYFHHDIALKSVNLAIWSVHFDDFLSFINHIESLAIFQYILECCIPFNSDLYLEGI